MGSYLWIIVTTTIMLCLMAFASPFGTYVKNSLEQFAGDFIEKEAEHNVPETERCELKIVYNTADSGQAIEAASIDLKKYEQYSIPSPQIPGYVPNIKTVEGTIYEDTTIYVDYTRGNYTITYVTNNGTFDATLLNAEGKLKTSYTNYTYGDNVVLLGDGDVKRGSMNFLGWYDNEAFAGNPVTEIKPSDYGNKVYYAKWSSVDYTITYILNDASGQHYFVANENAAGSIAGFDSVVTDSNGNLKAEYTSYTYGTQLKLPTTVHKFGYTFVGWSEEPDGSMVDGNYRTQITETDSGNKVFYAHWKRNTYTITYHTGFIRPTGEKVYYEIKDSQYTVIDSQGRSRTYEGFPTSYTYGDTIVLPTKLVLNGYDKSAITEIAWYNKQTEKITITSGGDNAGTVNGYPTDAINKTTISPATIGFVLGDNSGHAYDHTDLDLYIMPTPDKYTIIYNSNIEADAFTRPNVENYTQGFLYDEVKNLTANKFSMIGRTFLDWNSKSDGSGKTFKDKENVTNVTDIVVPNANLEIQLYAQWRMNNYNIKYDLNKGHGTTTPSFAVNGSYPNKATFDTAFYVTAPVRPGYTFIGWKVVQGLYEDTARYGLTSTPATNITSSTICGNDVDTTDVYFVNLTPIEEGTVTLQAQWRANGAGDRHINFCRIQYDLNRGSSTTTPKLGAKAPISYVFDTSFEVSHPTMEGYTFTGWTISNLDTDITHYFGNSSFTVTQGSVTTNATTATGGTTAATLNNVTATHFINLKKHGTVNFKANWRPNTYTITYDLNRGNGTTIPEHGASHPTSATFDKEFTISNPTRVGYKFTGWNISGMDGTKHYYGVNTSTATTLTVITDTTFKNLRSTSGTVKFTATWTPNTYTITYDLNKGAGSSTPSNGTNHPTQGTFDANVLISNPTRAGYSFAGWTISGMDTAVTHYYGSSAYSLSGNEVTPGSNATTNTSITTARDATNFINLRASSGTVTFKANWTNNVYTITLNKQGGTGGTTTIYEKFDIGFYSDFNCTNSIPTITPPSKVGYIYDGYWASANKGGDQCISGNNIVMANNRFSSDATIHAGYTARTYNIEYDLNKGKGTTTPSHGSSHPNSATYDVQFTVSNPTRPHYDFAGWLISGMSTDCTHYYGSATTTDTEVITSATTYKNLHSGNGTVKFFAMWTPKVYTITLTGGTGGTGAYYQKYDTGIYADGACTTPTSKITKPSRTGYTYTGHSLSGTQYVNSSGTILSGDTTFKQNTTLTATWTPNTYSITYNLNGGSYGSSHPTSATYDVSFTVSHPSRVDYDFKGWDISGMDNCTHYYGSKTTTSTSISKSMETSYENLRSTSGTVTFTANWELSHVHAYTSVTQGAGCTQAGKITYTCTVNDNRCDRPVYEEAGAAAAGHWNSASNADGSCQAHHTSSACTDIDADGEDGINAAHGTSGDWSCIDRHDKCSCGAWEDEGRTHAYCARQTTFKDNSQCTQLTSGGNWFCGYNPWSWCYEHAGYTLATYGFNCSSVVKSSWISIGHSCSSGFECSPYKVTWNANGGSGGGTTDGYHGGTWSPAQPTRSGYTFKGWYTAASGGSYQCIIENYNLKTTGATTVYAQWTCKHESISLDRTKSNATYHYKYCNTCGELRETTAHTWNRDAATCTAAKSCSICGYVGQAALGHNSSSYGGTANVHTKCSRCGTAQSSNHSYTVSTGVTYSDATCTANRRDYYKCVCGYDPRTYAATKAVSGTALGCEAAAISTWKYATNGASTHTKYKTCKRCSSRVNSSSESHNWNNGSVTKAATCTATGTKTYTCKNCSQTKTETIAKTAHSYRTGTNYRVYTYASNHKHYKYNTCACGAKQYVSLDQCYKDFACLNKVDKAGETCYYCGHAY